MYAEGIGVEKDETQTVEWYRKAADHGDATAQYYLGRMYAKGIGVEKDEAQAVEWYRKAADQGDADAQNNLAVMHANGIGTEKDEAKAITWYQKAADHGNATAQYNLGRIYARGIVVEKNEAKAVEWYRKAADQGNADAQNNLGGLYADGCGVEKDEAKAVEWYRKAADQGNSTAQYNIGRMYTRGLGVEKDEAKGVEWYRKAAERGDADAQNILGFKYEHGIGVAKNELQTIEWYRKAAEQGNATAQCNLGRIYAKGLGVEKDEAQAFAWYCKAADQGDADAQNQLGIINEHGHGVAKDEAQAVEWFRKAAEKGDRDAQYNLGRMYAYGHGIVKDEDLAIEWFRKAEAKGHLDASQEIAMRRKDKSSWTSCHFVNTSDYMQGMIFERAKCPTCKQWRNFESGEVATCIKCGNKMFLHSHGEYACVFCGKTYSSDWWTWKDREEARSCRNCRTVFTLRKDTSNVSDDGDGPKWRFVVLGKEGQGGRLNPGNGCLGLFLAILATGILGIKTIAIIASAVVILAVTGCYKTTGIMEVGNNTYTIVEDGQGTLYMAKGELMKRAYEKANVFCANQNMAMQPVSDSYNTSGFAGSYTLQFKKIDPNEPRDNRPQKNGVLTPESRASADTIKVLNYQYDAKTRKGVLAVDMGGHTLDESRDWVVRNIGRISSSKELLLEAGRETKTGGHYRLLDESVQNGVLTVGFTAGYAE